MFAISLQSIRVSIASLHYRANHRSVISHRSIVTPIISVITNLSGITYSVITYSVITQIVAPHANHGRNCKQVQKG